MAPTAFADFGSKADGLFNDHHDAGQLSFTRNGSHGANNYSLSFKNAVGEKPVSWNFETEVSGVKISYDHENTLTKEITVGVKQVEGLTLKWNPSFHPTGGLNLGNINANFVNENTHFNATSGLCGKPVVDIDVSQKVKKCCGMELGFQGSFDTSSMAFTSGQFGGQCTKGDLQCSWKKNLTSDFGIQSGSWSFYKALPAHKNFCCYGVQSDSTNTLAVAVATNCEKQQMRYKLDQNGQLSVAKVHTLNGSARLNLSAAFNLANMSGGGHQFGMGLTFE